MRYVALTLIAAVMPIAGLAESPEVEDVKISKVGMDWRVDVTLRHPDTGWDHYADGWEVLDHEGNVLGYRELLHPHVDEQPFTRSLHNVVLPDGAREIRVKTRCNRDGWAPHAHKVDLTN